jgi:hypothetical protein
LEVSASGYYDWVNRQAQPSPRTRENARLANLTRATARTKQGKCQIVAAVGLVRADI